MNLSGKGLLLRRWPMLRLKKHLLSIDMNNSPVTFQATGEVIKFDGFLRVYTESTIRRILMKKDMLFLL